MQSSVNPDSPLVVSSSTDIGYITYLMSRAAPYRSWSADRIMEMLLPALRSQQLRLYCDSAGSPIAFAAWAWVDDKTDLALQKREIALAPEEWCSGNRLWILHFLAPFGGARGVIRELRNNVFPDVKDGKWVRYATNGAIRRIARWRPSLLQQSTGSMLDERRVFDEVWGENARTGCFTKNTRLISDAVTEADRQIITRLSPEKGAKVLDIGCGTGYATRLIAEKYGCHASGIDVATHRINRACEIAQDTPHLTFQQADLSALPYKPQTFDSALAREVLSYSQDVPAALAECARVLKPGGRLVITELTAKQQGKSDTLMKAIGARSLLSINEWEDALSTAGFDVTTVEDCTERQRQTYQQVMRAIERSYAKHTGGQQAARKMSVCLEAIDRGEFGQAIFTVARRRTTGPAVPAPILPTKKKTTLVMLSGGVDSVYTLWALLAKTDDNIVVHHINFANPERRHVIEAERCRKIVNYLRQATREFEYSESTLDRRQLAFFGYDMISVGFEAGLVAHSHLLRTNTLVDRWVVGSCAEEGNWHSRFQHAQAGCVANCFPHPAPEVFSLPVVTKQEEIAAMPSELVALTWGCRRPIHTEAGYRPCGVCQTCRILGTSSTAAA